MFPKGSIITGPLWDEPVEVISFVHEPGIGYLAQVSGRKSQRFYEDYIMAEDMHQVTMSKSGAVSLDSSMIASLIQYHFLKQDICFSDQQARGNSNVIPLPHQIEAVYSRMLQTSSVRYLLADDPGAGKTIMSGMLINEMIARGDATRILILVPPLVLTQWQEELKSKFGEDFTIVNRGLLNGFSGNPFVEHDKVLCSLYWGMRDEIKAEISAANYDLVIIDEAHKMAAYTTKKRQTKRTKLYRLGEALAQKCEHLVLLTATPHKGDRENYRHLMRLVDEDIFNETIDSSQLHDIAKPYVIRRLKESMVQFDGTPLFPKRTTKTLTFHLSQAELKLYKAVTDYVSEHFNRAKREGNRSTSFAMMLLQRRLSSSLEAIYVSLLRRRDRLVICADTEQKRIEQWAKEIDENNDITTDELESFENNMLGATTEIDPIELQIEIEELDRLIALAEDIRRNNVEYKYDALEQALFGESGLIANNEKLLIFTESKDTLLFLQRRLEERIGEVVLIEGSMNMEQRQIAVRRFREEVPILIATDAGGESINLQFCNQMVNYDIPWNPNKLEQRMGRIHRIGQKNEVFIFNLVASNTREGQVMERLLTKLETMRKDLGNDLVYDFLGDVLDDQGLSLDDLMIEAIEDRERLDEVIAKMDKVLSEEHSELIELAKRERLADSVDLPGVRRSFNDIQLRALPHRAYSYFLRTELEKQQMNSTERVKNVFRIRYVPKAVLSKARQLGIYISKDEDFVLTTDRSLASEEAALVTVRHPLITLFMNAADEERMATRLATYKTNLSTPEPLQVVVVNYRLRDGNNRIIDTKLQIFAERESGEFIELSPHWLYSLESATFVETSPLNNSVLIAAKRQAVQEQQLVKTKRQFRGFQKQHQLEFAFDKRIEDLKQRLNEFEETNFDNKNSANINKYNSRIREQEQRKQERIAHVHREGSVSLQKLEAIVSLQTATDSYNWRVFPTDVRILIELHEENAGRTVRIQPALGLVDFYSEDSEGNKRFILMAKSLPIAIDNIGDYAEIIDECYIYVVDGYLISDEVPMKMYK
ncbi:helicase-related protein [Bacillus tropicus]|uniref:helicase-related protein n=1 Tax=Bacillus tropicus TaxID=2026188 RepID=UPI00093638E1|nr:helicase-related protein [Bacillus tropicus]MED3382669.1 helicase-related protein [Bacillus tropicus]